jgi:hypothetical protein
MRARGVDEHLLALELRMGGRDLAKRSSQNGIVWMIPLDFVAEQMRPDRVAASATRTASRDRCRGG